MHKAKLHYAIAIGLVAAVIAIAIMTLMSYTAAGQDQLLDLLSMSGGNSGVAFNLYYLENGPFFLAMIALLLLEVLCGILAVLFARPSGDTIDGLMASVAAGLLPALAFGLFYFNSWRIGMARYEAHAYVRPMEPAPAFLAVGLVGFLMILLLLAAVAGSCLAQIMLRSNAGAQ